MALYDHTQRLCRFAPLAPGAKIVSHLLRAKTTFVGFMSLKRIAKIVTVTECTPIGEKHKVDMLENPRCVSTKLDVVHVVCSSTAAVWSHQMFHLIINDTKHLTLATTSFFQISSHDSQVGSYYLPCQPSAKIGIIQRPTGG